MTTITRRPRGFTLVELLVVIGIILVLIAIVVMGIRHTGYMASRHETEVEMKVLGDMLAEYQAINGMKNIEGPANLGPAVPMKLPDPPYMGRSYTLPIYIDQMNDSIAVTDLKGSMSPKNPPAPAESGDMSDKGNGNNPRYSSKAMYNMMGIMYILLKDPKNRALISNLPPKRILETWSGFGGGPANLPQFTIDAAIPLDGWGNPIFFVPRGGLHVYLDPAGLHDIQNSARTGTVLEYVVRTSGTYLVSSLPPISPNDRPFFASAGPDGYVSDLSAAGAKIDRATDNFYSFQAQSIPPPSHLQWWAMPDPTPPPLPPPVPVPVQSLAYSAPPRRSRPGIVTAIGVVAIVLACLSGISSFITCVYGSMFYAFAPMFSSGGSGGSGGSPFMIGPSAVSTPAAPQDPKLPMGDAAVAVNSLRAILQLDGARQRELDKLLRTHGREVLGKPTGADEDDPTPGAVTDPWIRESVKESHPSAGYDTSAWFVDALGRVDVFADHAEFKSADGSRTIATSAANSSETITDGNTTQMQVQAYATSNSSSATAPTTMGSQSTTLTKEQVAKVLRAVKRASVRPLNASQLTTLEQQLSAPNQEYVTPDTATPVTAVTPVGLGVTVQFDQGMISLDPNGKITTSWTSSRPLFSPKLIRLKPAVAVLISEGVASMALAIYLLIVGIMVCRSSFRSPRLLRIYAWIKILLAIIGAIGLAWLIHGAYDIAAASSPSGTVGFTPVVPVIWAIVVLILGVAFPIAVLICLRTQTVRDYFNSVSA